MCNFTAQFERLQLLHFGMVKLPSIVISDEKKISLGLSPIATNQEFLLALARAGYKTHESSIPASQRKVYGERIKRELATFDELGFTNYVLLVWLVINKARELGVFIDYGRGSCAGSAVFWLLGITGVDPIEKRLLFERFVSRVRSKKQVIDGEVYLQGDLIADADLNLGNGLEQIVEWLNTVYPGAVSKIVTHTMMKGKVLINDVYKAIEGVSNEEAQRVSGMLESKYQVVQDIADAYDKNPEFKSWADKHQMVYHVCLQLRDQIRQTGVHASGYVISPQPFDGFLPIQLSKDKEIISCYEMEDVCNFAVKLDLLGLTTNRIIKEVLEKTGEDITKLNLDSDPMIYDRFQDGKLLPYGLYQVSADCAYGVAAAIKPKNIFELSDLNAMARPGALAYLQPYVDNNVTCPHPVFENILKPTRNLCLYQEQMMQMAVAVGFTLDEAEILRKIVGKKLIDKVKEWKEKIYARVKQTGLPENVGDILWKILEDSASYSFNASHSLATSYLTALTVYLKYKYPKEFMCACLNVAKNMEERMQITQELDKLGIKLLPPDIIKSKLHFSIEQDGIRYGLESVRGIKTVAAKLASLNRPFESKFELFEVAKAAKINIAVLTGIIYSGCIDSLIVGDSSRSHLALEAQLYNLLTPREKLLVKRFNNEYHSDLLALIKGIADKKNEKGKPLIEAGRLNTLRRDYQSYWDDFIANSKNDALTSYLHERHYLGFSYTSTLHAVYSSKVVGLTPVKDLPTVVTTYKEPAKVVAFVGEGKLHVSAKGDPYWRGTLLDDSGTILAMLFGSEKLESCRARNGDIPKEGAIIIGTGSMSKDKKLFFLESMIEQVNPIKPTKKEVPI